jgi:hypothetical protein
MSITGTYSLDDFLAGAWLHFRRKLMVLALGLVFFAYAGYSLSTGAPAWAVWLPICFVVWLLAVVVVGIPYRCRREFSQRKDLQRQITFAPDSSGLRITSAALSGLKPWSDYIQWKEGRTVFLLYMSDRTFTVVPKRFFASGADVQSFRELVSGNVLRRETAP